MFNGGRSLYREGEECCDAAAAVGKGALANLGEEDDDDDDEEEEEEPSTVRRRQVGPLSPEVQRAMHGIQKGVATVKSRDGSVASSARGNAAAFARGGAAAPLAGTVFAPLAHVPWWGWILIALHLAYRIYKVRS